MRKFWYEFDYRYDAEVGDELGYWMYSFTPGFDNFIEITDEEFDEINRLEGSSDDDVQDYISTILSKRIGVVE